MLGQQLNATDALGVVTQTTYDIMGNVMQTVANYQSGAPADSQTNVTTKHTFDALGRGLTTTNPRGIVAQTVYDADGRVTTTYQNCQNCLGGGTSDSQTNVKATTAYDGAGNATLATDAKGNTTTTTYDADNRATEVKVQASGGAMQQDTKTTYDAAGLKLTSQVIDGANNPTTSYTYDAAGRAATETDPPADPGASDQSGKSDVTTSTYDADGDLLETKVTNAALSAPVSDATAAFDKLGRTTSKTAQANTSAAQTTTYAYDADGRQTSTTDPANQTSATAYDALGRALVVTHPDGTKDTTTYDAAGRALTQSNSAGTTTDSYDPLGRVASERRADGGGATQTTVTYVYDANGNKTQETTTYAGGATAILSSSYDPLDRLATQSDGTRSYTYDANGNATQQLVLNGSATAVEADATYDGANRLTGLTDYTGAGRSYLTSDGYTYDGDGNRTQVTEGGTTTSYAYDGANQLVQVKDGTGLVTATYSYDANHNRTSMVTSAGTTTYAYDSASDTELTSQTDPAGKVTSYVYDTNGDLTKAVYDASGANQVTSYGYDTSNRLTSVTKPDGTAVAFAYDADGNRNSKAVTSGGTTTAVNDVYQLGHLAEQTDGTGTMLASFSYDSQGVPTSVQVGSDPATAPRYYYVYNGHGDVVALTDANGTAVATYDYDAWGAVTVATERFANGWHNPYLYDGRDGVRYDTETGLYWMSVRAYDPTLGRFLQHDPLGRVPLFFADQPYAYAGNNPLMNIDPSGQRMATTDDAGVRVESSDDVRASRHYAQHHWRVYYRRGPVCDLSCRGRHKKANLLAFWGTVLDGLGAALALVQVGRDLAQLFEDWNSVAGLDRTIGLAVDTVSILADVASLGVGILVFLSHWFNVSGWLHAFRVLAVIGQALAGALKVIRSASGWFARLAKVLFWAAVTAFKTATSEIDVGPLVLGIGLALLKQFGFKVDAGILFDGLIAFVQAAITGVGGIIDAIQGTSDAGICRRYGC